MWQGGTCGTLRGTWDSQTNRSRTSLRYPRVAGRVPTGCGATYLRSAHNPIAIERESGVGVFYYEYDALQRLSHEGRFVRFTGPTPTRGRAMSGSTDNPLAPVSPLSGSSSPAAGGGTGPDDGEAAELAAFLAAENVANDYHPGLDD